MSSGFLSDTWREGFSESIVGEWEWIDTTGSSGLGTRAVREDTGGSDSSLRGGAGAASSGFLSDTRCTGDLTESMIGVEVRTEPSGGFDPGDGSIR